jgi:hypothetical protein
MNALLKSVLLSAALLFSQGLFAAQLYFDGGLGSSSVEIEDFDGSDIYFRLGVGGKISDNISIEGGYWDLGDAEDGPVTVSVNGLFANAKFSLDLNSDTSLFGKIGLYMWDGEVCLDGFGCGDDDGNDLFYGAGVSFDMGPGQLNLEILLSELGSDIGDFDVMTIGGSYSIPFGR